ncbi:MAG: hypothetical protein Q8P86_02200 [bacterium]|nr:hypothetical protein [bacterium]
MKKIIGLLVSICIILTPILAQSSGGGGVGGTSLPVPSELFPTSTGYDLSLPMIQSEGLLKAYAKDVVKSGEINISHAGIVPYGHASVHANIQTGGADAVVQKLRQTPFLFELGTLKGKAEVHAYLWDEMGEILFSHNHTSNLEVKKGGGVWFPDGQNHIAFKLASEVPIKIAGLSYARIVIRREDGSTQEVYPRIYAGRLYFPSWLAGLQGEIYLQTQLENERREHVLGLQNGAPKGVAGFTHGYMGIGIEGEYDFGINPSGVGLWGVDIRSAIVYFEIRGGPMEVLFGGADHSGEAPFAFVLRTFSEEENRWSVPFVQSLKTEKWILGEGKYQVVYILPPILPQPPTQGGGGRG